ncbi:MAG TPA: DUF2721 domain-containing protein [Armatimonadota bacterium]|nr:DUF2721 domain-containing protein [Armatimonadota bacterium]
MPLTELTAALAILSAVITPAVLIAACASLAISTAARVSRVISRTRELSAHFERMVLAGAAGAIVEDEYALLLRQIAWATRRSELLQRALANLYFAIGAFVLTSVSLGAVAATDWHTAWLPIVFGLLGVGALLYVSILLIVDARIGLTAVHDEMNYIFHRSKTMRLTGCDKRAREHPDEGGSSG